MHSAKNEKNDEFYTQLSDIREDMYPKYDNYDATNVDKVTEIICYHTGVMGVSIGFLSKGTTNL